MKMCTVSADQNTPMNTQIREKAVLNDPRLRRLRNPLPNWMVMETSELDGSENVFLSLTFNACGLRS